MISVIIPTRNRADLLQTALDSIADQTLSRNDFELLVVDNGSTDHTGDLLSAYMERLENLRVFREAAPGLHEGRHRGLAEANGEVLVFADDDIRATSGWLEAVAENFLNPEVSMLGGNNFPDFNGEPPGWLTRLWVRPALGGQAIVQLSVLSLPDGRREIDPYLVFGCNFSIRKKVLLDAGGFHPDSMPDDLIRFRGDGESHVSKFVLDNGLKCIFDPRASVYHAVTPERMTFEYFRKREFSQGISDSYSMLRNGRKRRPLSHYPRKLAKRLLGGIRDRVREGDPELEQLAAQMQAGHKEGFDYHQQQYREDPEVRAWVHKPDYFQESHD